LQTLLNIQIIKEKEPSKPAVRGIMVVFRGQISILESSCLECNFQMVVLSESRAGQLQASCSHYSSSNVFGNKVPWECPKPPLEPQMNYRHISPVALSSLHPPPFYLVLSPGI